MNAITGNPGQRDLKTVEVEFGLTLTAEAGALVAKASTEAYFTVKLIWERLGTE